MRITILIFSGLLQFFSVPYLCDGADAEVQESLGEKGITEMEKRLEGERQELERLKILFDNISKKDKQVTESGGEDVKVAMEAAEGSEGKRADGEQVVSQEERIEEVGEQDSTDKRLDAEKKEREKITINDIDKIIKPFEIAENLYKMEEYQLSLDIYKLIKVEEEEENRSWIKYQIANCYRKLKQFDKAVQVYREVDKEFEGSYWAIQSQWYIRDIDWRKETIEKMEAVDEK
ncbi:MAG: hypothetical protein GY941_21380 [Planctomycetes bacterium]|nr:hypothetical protein [Planctomycetota bacterium]